MFFYHEDIRIGIGFLEDNICSIVLGTKAEVNQQFQDLEDKYGPERLINEAMGFSKVRQLSDLYTLTWEDVCGYLMNLNCHEMQTFTPFQISVLKAIFEIPKGSTKTYKELAEAVGKPKAFRAVASVCVQNPFALLIPCQRVVPTDSKKFPGEYRWGAELKKIMLQKEKFEVFQ